MEQREIEDSPVEKDHVPAGHGRQNESDVAAFAEL